MSLQIVAIALVADRPEALLHDHFSEAEDRIERRADFVADLGEEIGFQRACPLGPLAGVFEFLLNLLPMRHVAEKRAEFLFGRVILRRPDTSERHENRDQAALLCSADDLAAVVEQARDAVRFQPTEIILHLGLALRRDQHRERLAGDLALVVAEKSLAGTVERQNPSLGIEHGETVRRGVENGIELPHLVLLRPHFCLEAGQGVFLIVAAQGQQRRRQMVPFDRLDARANGDKLARRACAARSFRGREKAPARKIRDIPPAAWSASSSGKPKRSSKVRLA